MVGVPYVASGPLAHSLSLDKVVTKMILRQHDLPTPDFAVLNSPDDPVPELSFPLIVKPKSEAVSFGLCIVEDEAELRNAVRRIYEEYRQPVLVEQYIAGREINVGLLGNNPPEALPPVELRFGDPVVGCVVAYFVRENYQRSSPLRSLRGEGQGGGCRA